MPWLRGAHEEPPSTVCGETPPVKSAQVTDEASVGCGRIVRKRLAAEAGRPLRPVGVVQSARSSRNCSPPSSERNTAPGSVPA